MNQNIPSQKIGLSEASRIIMGFQVQLIEEFRDHVIEAYDNKMSNIANWFNTNRPENYDDADYYYQLELNVVDEGETLDSIKELTYELSLVALYRTLEINTSKLLRKLYSQKVFKKENLYIMPNYINKLLRDHNIDVKSLTHFHSANECRAINNSIKHSNKVGPELFNDYSANGWALDTDMNTYDLNAHFARLAPDMPLYFQELATQVANIIP